MNGNGWGSSTFTRKTNHRGRLTVPMRPSVDVMPTFAMAQKSATISEIQRSHRRQAGRSGTGAVRCIPCRVGRKDSTRPRRAAA